VVSLVTVAANVEPWQGMAAVGVLAAVVAFLFKWADTRISKAEGAKADADKANAVELEKRNAREVAIRAECEAKIAAQAKEHAEALRHIYSDNRVHEDAMRKEFTAVVGTISEQTSKSAEVLTEVLGKLHDRFTGPRSPR